MSQKDNFDYLMELSTELMKDEEWKVDEGCKMFLAGGLILNLIYQ